MLLKNDPLTVGSFNVAETTNAPLRLAKSTWLRATPGTIFSIVANHAELAQLFPWVQDVTVDTSQAPDGGVGTRRCCNFGNGMALEEEIVAWEPPHMYAYASIAETHPFGMQGHVGLVACEADALGMTLIWRHFFDHPNPEAMQEKMDGSLNMALQRLIKRFGGKLLETYINFK